jgi:hypothetical protein
MATKSKYGSPDDIIKAYITAIRNARGNAVAVATEVNYSGGWYHVTGAIQTQNGAITRYRPIAYRASQMQGFISRLKQEAIRKQEQERQAS